MTNSNTEPDFDDVVGTEYSKPIPVYIIPDKTLTGKELLEALEELERYYSQEIDWPDDG